MLDAINFCFGSVTENEIEALQHWIKILEEMTFQWNKGIVFDNQTYVLDLFNTPNIINDNLRKLLKMSEWRMSLQGLVIWNGTSLDFVWKLSERLERCLFLSNWWRKATLQRSLQLSNNTQHLTLQSEISLFWMLKHTTFSYAQYICVRWDEEIRRHKEAMTSSEMLVDPMEAVAHLLPKTTSIPMESLTRNDEKEMDIDSWKKHLLVN